MPRSARSVPRDGAIDIARGIGIVLVVYGHVLRGLDSRGLIGGSWIGRQDALIYSFHMALFFLLAGAVTHAGKKGGTPSFLASRTFLLLYPYVLWSLVQTFLAHHFSPHSITDVGWTGLRAMFVRPVAEYWFLYTLFLCQLLLALFGQWRIAVVGLALASALIVPAPGLLPPIAGLTLHFFLFVGVGFLIGDALPARLGALETLPQIAGTSVAGIVFWALFTAHPGGPASWINVVEDVTALAGIAFILFLSGLLRDHAPWLALLGRASMAIYVAHTIVIGFARLLLLRIGMGSGVIGLVLLTAIGIAVPLGLYLAASRFNLAPLLGLGRNAQGKGEQTGLS